MSEFLLVLLGGFFNWYNFYSKVGDKGGYVAAFIMGAIFYGLPMWFLYWLFS